MPKEIDFKPYCSKSYKMMWDDGKLKDGLTLGFKIKNMNEYTPGRQFTATGSAAPMRFGVIAPNAIFHFCDNAVDTLMWYWLVFDFLDFDAPTVNFFEVKPLDSVYKNRAPDETYLWQCGTNKLEIVCKTSLAQVARDAMMEIQQNRAEIIARYPHLNMERYIIKIQRQAGR